MPLQLEIRPATADVSSRLAELFSQWGYRSDASRVQARLSAVAAHEDYATFVATTGGIVIGIIGIRTGPVYEGDDIYAQVMVLGVDECQKRQGFASRPLAPAESWLASKGVEQVVVHSGLKREDAHAFYANAGHQMTGNRYVKRRSADG